MLHYRWINKEKQRYYKILFAQDLFGHWVVTKAWGGLNHAHGGMRKVTCFSYEEGMKIIKKIFVQRKRRGYCIINQNDTE